MSRTADRMAAIAEAAEAFHEAVFDLDVLLHIVAERISRATGDFCSVLLLSPDGRRIEPLVAYHPDPRVLQDARQFLGISMDLDAAGPWARVLRERRSVIIAVDPDHLPPDMAPHQARNIRRWRVREAALIPLIARDTVVGGLNLNRLEGSPPFTPDDIDLLESLGAGAARAIANARLLQAEKQAAGGLERQVQERTRVAEARALEARAAVARLQAVLITPLSTVVIATDPAGLITLFNSGAEQLLGYAAQEVVGTATPALFMSSIEIEAKAAALGVEPAFAALASGYSTSGACEEWILITRTGGERPVELSISPTLGADQSRLGFVLIAQHISERKALEADLSAALAEGREVVTPAVARRDEVAELAHGLAAWERFSRQRLEGSRAMAELSSLTEVDDVIQVGLQRMGATFGARQGFVSLAETEGARVAAVLDPDKVSTAFRVGALLDPQTPGVDALATAAPVRLEFDAGWSKTPASWGPEFGAGHVMALPLVSGARVAGIVTLIRSRTDEPFSAAEVELAATMSAPLASALVVSRLVAELRQSNARLIEANLHKTQFLGNMSHELRTPLSAILGFSELLLDDDESRFTRVAQRGFLEHIHAGGQHLLDLINDILDLSKVEAGEMKLRLATVAVAKVVGDVVSTVEPLAAKKRLQVETNSSSAGELVADAGKLAQMLLNLVSNAIKFTPEGGIIKIAARRTTKTMEISVADSGIGISQADRGRIFQEFQQLDTGVGRQTPGTGLGLALTRRYAALHGGDVRVESEVGKGSVFTLSLPLTGPVVEKEPQEGPVQSITHAVAVADRPLVLIVEDDPAVAELVTHIVEGGGFRSEIARTGVEALAKARQLHPVAITLDIVLPDLDGWKVLKQLKNDETTSGIPVAVVSVVDNPELGAALGALDYFVKPVRANDLLEQLRHMVASQSVDK